MSSWDTTSGLLETFQIDVKEAWFGTNDKYQSGKTLLLNFKGSASVEGDVVDPEHHIWFGCGDKWKAGQGGAVAVNTAGAEKFQEQSGLGKLIDGIKDLDPEMRDQMMGRGETYESDTWVGLIIDLDRQKTGEFKDKATGEMRERYDYIPQALAISDDTDSAPAPAAKSNSGGGKAAAAKLRVAVKKLAADYDDNDDFVTAVLDADVFDQASAVEENEELLDAIIDGSIHAEAH